MRRILIVLGLILLPACSVEPLVSVNEDMPVLRATFDSAEPVATNIPGRSRQSISGGGALPADSAISTASDTFVVATSTPIPTELPPANLPTKVPESDLVPVADRFILVDQDAQMMTVYEQGNIVKTIPVSTGKPVSNAFTPPWQGVVGQDWGSGPFVGGLYSDYKWFLFPGPEGSILIHSVPYARKGEERIYDRLDSLGVEPVSLGCVRISPEDAAWLKMWNPVDVSIEITRWSGKISTVEEE